MDLGCLLSIILGLYLWILMTASSLQKHPGDGCTDSSHRNGSCALLRECIIIQQELNMGIRPTSCGFSRGLPVVCCPGCKEYSKHCPKIYENTGVTPRLPQVVSHMAAVGYGPRDSIHWKCGGSLISDKFVLTAAHCIEEKEHGPVHWVLLGTQINPPIEGKSLDKRGQIHEVVHSIAHPGYSPPAKYDDIALLKIGPSVTKNPLSLLSKELHPACLRPDSDVGYVYNIVSRWSGAGFGDDPKLELLRVALKVLDEAKCNDTFENDIKATGLLPRGFDFNTMCAEILKGGKDICQGDYGGPLQFPVSGECQHEISGIISFGQNCTFVNSPSVFMRVSSYIEWIEDNVWPHPKQDTINGVSYS